MEEVIDRQRFRMTARQAAEYFGVSIVTLTKMEKEGELVPFRTPGGHRRYSLEVLEEYAQSKRRSTAPKSAHGSI
jgi:excisionase family DNA binding protein